MAAYLVCPIHVYKKACLEIVMVLFQLRMSFFPRLLKRLESLSYFCRKKGEHNTFNSSELLSVTSSISWHYDTEELYHLSNNTLFIHKISRYISRCVILCLTRSTESQNAKGHAAMHSISQGKTLVICCGGSNHIISPRGFAFWEQLKLHGSRQSDFPSPAGMLSLTPWITF